MILPPELQILTRGLRAMKRIVNVGIASYGLSGKVFHGPYFKALPKLYKVGKFRQ